ncbi:MAG: DNA-directed DNA polymerase, partial [Nanoarchaeota archaeon]|nr:DNA-directed DNA polymerase [Nanoarchaeota archaeon]
KGKRICVIDSFEPYFWAILKPNLNESQIKKLQEKVQKISFENAGRQVRILKTIVEEKNFLSNPVKAVKIFINNYKDAHPVADHLDLPEIDKRRDYDIPIITRYIIEKQLLPLNWYSIKGEVLDNSDDFGGIGKALDVDLCLKVDSITPLVKSNPASFPLITLKKSVSESEPIFQPKVLAFDIETEEFEIGKGEILMISLAGKNFQKVLTWKKCKKLPDFVECFKNEEEMLESFVKYIKSYSPDILTGYFSDGFDLPYLRARAQKLGVKLSLGLDESQPSFSRGRVLTAKLSGITHVDLFRFIETAYSQYLQSETLSLNEVSKELLNEEKHEFGKQLKKGMTISTEEEWQNFFAYNLQDSVLTYKLFEKLWYDMSEFCKVIQEPLFNVTRNGMSQLVELYLLHNLIKFNEIPEKRPLHNEISERMTLGKYEGAFVFRPTPGLYNNLAIFDFTSMYASVIVTYNLSKSTFLEKKEKNALEVDLGKSKAYFSKEKGFFPALLEEIIKKRKQFKTEFKKSPSPILKARSNAFKLIANAAYGYQGFFGARYYCREAAASTAALARKNILEVIEKIKKAGYEVIYSDTDSIALLLGKKTKQNVLDLLKKINSELPGIMELDLEEFYKRGIWVAKRTGEFGAKKKYALLDEKGKLKIRGFETVRRDWCSLARELQNQILKLILNEGNEQKALEVFKKTVKELKERKIDKKDILIRTQLKKPLSEYKAISPHVIAARKMMEKNEPVNIGMLVEFYISEVRSEKEKKLVREKVKLPDEKGEYNIKYYLEHQLIPAVENIFDGFNINIKEIVDGKRQMKLGEF